MDALHPDEFVVDLLGRDHRRAGTSDDQAAKRCKYPQQDSNRADGHLVGHECDTGNEECQTSQADDPGDHESLLALRGPFIAQADVHCGPLRALWPASSTRARE